MIKIAFHMSEVDSSFQKIYMPDESSRFNIEEYDNFIENHILLIE